MVKFNLMDVYFGAIKVYVRFLFMASLIPIDLEVIKPPLCRECMCVYKFTLDNGFYYYGATSDLQERIIAHIKKYRNGKLQSAFREPFKSANKIVFEIVRYANNREKLKGMEEYYLGNNVGLPKCLNEQLISTSAFKRGNRIYKIGKLDIKGNVIKIYDRIEDASSDLNITVKIAKSRLLSKYAKMGYFLRNIDYKGDVVNPQFSVLPFDNGRKPVVQYDNKMNVISTYISIAAASKATGVNEKSIRHTANGKRKTGKGFIFLFLKK